MCPTCAGPDAALVRSILGRPADRVPPRSQGTGTGRGEAECQPMRPLGTEAAGPVGPDLGVSAAGHRRLTVRSPDPASSKVRTGTHSRTTDPTASPNILPGVVRGRLSWWAGPAHPSLSAGSGPIPAAVSNAAGWAIPPIRREHPAQPGPNTPFR